MNRLKSKVNVAAAEGSPPFEHAPEPSAYPLYVDNLIYLPFARHLAEEDMDGGTEELSKAA